MSIGFKATLFAGAITLSAFAPAYAAAPVIQNMPDVTIGDLEDSTGATDNNLFVFSDAFTFGDFVADADNEDHQLLWSFGEFNGGLANSQYSINGVTAVNVGDAEIMEDEANGHEKAKSPGVSRINELEVTASFRDIVLSPPADSAPYPEPTQAQKDLAEAGKFIRYYVSDGTNVAYSDAMINTVDDGSDTTTPAYNANWSELERDTDLSGDGWVNTGIGWSAVTTSKANGELGITVAPTFASSRFFGWINPALVGYDSIGPDKFVRAKFYIYTNVSVLEPINKVPNFRLRITHENAINAATHYELSATGLSDPGYEPFYAAANNPQAETNAGYWLRPADNGNNGEGNYSPTPSLYRVDYDPVDVPAAVGSNIGALMESYALSDTADGTLFLTEVVIGSYNALDNSGNLVWSYDRADGVAGGEGGPKVFSGGGFNHEPNLSPGYLQNLYFAGQDPEFGGYFTLADEGVNGLVGDTAAVDYDVFGIGLMNLQSADNVNKLRIAPNKLYHARFYATAPVPSTSTNGSEETQGAIRFRFQTAANTVSHLLDMTTLSFGSLNGPSTPNADDIAAQALPSTLSQNPDTDASLDTAGEGGGWYSIVVPSPMDVGGIRNDVETLFETEENTFFVLSGQPGPGDAGDSSRDVTLGVDLIQVPLNVETAFGNLALGRPNRAVVRVSALDVYEYPSIDDGGFDATPSAEHP